MRHNAADPANVRDDTRCRGWSRCQPWLGEQPCAAPRQLVPRVRSRGFRRRAPRRQVL